VASVPLSAFKKIVMLKTRYIILLFNAILYVTIPFAQTDPLIHYTGSAYDLKNNGLLYTDEYKEYITDAGELAATATYRYPNGDIIATKNIIYTHHRSSPSFTFSNHITGVIASVSANTSAITIAYRPSFESIFKIKTIPFPKHTVIDAGFYYFIIQSWDELMKGNAIPIHYVSPSKQSVFSLQVRKIRSERWKNRDTVLFKLDVKNLIIRLFVDHITLRYDANTQQLLTYEGLSNIKLMSGEHRIYMTISHHNSRVAK
jgi:hypothetical protein